LFNAALQVEQYEALRSQREWISLTAVERRLLSNAA
jgi:hypothetical protein